MRKIALFVLGSGLAAGLLAQAPRFEVASVRLVPPGEPARAQTADGALLRYPSTSLLVLLRQAYRLRSPEQLEGPAWMRSQLYQIEAKLPANSSRDQIPEMLQALLAERLQLSVHHETRLMPANVLLAGRKGSKLHQVPEEDEQLELKLDMPLVHLSGRGSIAKLTDQFNHALGGRDPWIDMTDLGGSFAIKLDYVLDLPANSPLAQRDDVVGMPTLAQALEQQLGLRVEMRKMPADIVVIDRVNRIPAEN